MPHTPLDVRGAATLDRVAGWPCTRLLKVVLLAGALLAALLFPATSLAHKGATPKGSLNVSSVVSAPVAPDGTVAGALTDVVLTFANRNPLVDGLPLKAGATVEVALPDAFLADRDGVNIGIILQGWPQSPPGPPPLFPWTTAVDGNTVTLTLTSDYLPGAKGPGPKQVHLLLGGFSNPQAAGMYPIELAITPDPASGETLRGIGTVEILAKTAPSIQPLSTVNGAPPPPFPNSLYQTLVPGEMPLSWGFYIWGRDGVPQVGADLVKQHDTLYWIVNGKGYRVDWVKVRPPRGAKTFELTTTGPAASADTVVTALPAALLKAQFTPDAYATGRYQVIWHMSGGTTQWMHLNVTSKTKMTVVSAVESAVVTGLDTPAHEDDVLVFQTTIHAGEGGPEIGRSGGRCDGTGAFPGVSPSHVCFTVTALAGGDIWHASWIPNPGEPVQAGAIIGGTGRYAHASGTVTFKDISKAGDFSLAENTYDVRHGARRSEQDAVKFTVVESFEFTGPETPRDEDDVLIFENTLHDGEGGPQVGRTAGRCDATGPLEGGRPADNCFSVSSFAEGDVWYAGWIPAPGDPAPPLPPAAIIGGTGKYAHASGTVTTTDLSKAGDFSTAESVFDIQLNTPKKKHGTRISAVALVESADFTGVDTPRSEDDVLIFESTIHDGAEGPQIGRLAGRCNATGPFPPGRPSDVCFSVHSLDGGDIWSTTWVPAPEGPTPDSAIIGGTGKYANASGTITTKDISEAGDFTVAQLDYNIQP